MVQLHATSGRQVRPGFCTILTDFFHFGKFRICRPGEVLSEQKSIQKGGGVNILGCLRRNPRFAYVSTVQAYGKHDLLL